MNRWPTALANFLIYGIVLFLSIGQLGRITIFDGISFFPHEILMGLYVLLSFPGYIKEGSQENFKKINIAAGSLIIVFGVSLWLEWWLYTPLQNLVGFLYFSRIVLYLSFFCTLLTGEKKPIQTGLRLFTILTIIFSYAQYFFYPNLRNLYYLGWDPHHFRAFGLFFDTTIAGIIYVLLFLHEFGKKQRNYFFLASLMGLILLSYSRITYIGFFAGLLYYFGKKTALLKLTAFGIVFVLLLLLLPRPAGESARLERLFTINARYEDMKEGVRVWSQKQLFGVGYNRIGVYKSLGLVVNHAQNSYSSTVITLLASTGVVGLLAFLYLLRTLFMSVDNVGRSIIITVGVASLFDNVLLQNFILILFIFCMVLSLSRKSQRSL